MGDPSTNPEERATPGRILRALQETAKAELPELGGGDESTPNPLEQELTPGAAGHGGDASLGEPTLEVERDGDHVRRITAVCSCGRKIDIHCDYEAARAAPAVDATAIDGGEPS